MKRLVYLLLMVIVLGFGCHGSPENGNVTTESLPPAPSPHHEVSFSLDPFTICLSDFCYGSKRVTFHLEEGQWIELWWHAYGADPEVYTTLIIPDGTRCTGHRTHPGGGPIDAYPCGPEQWGFDGDAGSTGNLKISCSSTYGESSGGKLYFPGNYTLVFQACGSASPLVRVRPGSEVNMVVTYEIR